MSSGYESIEQDIEVMGSMTPVPVVAGTHNGEPVRALSEMTWSQRLGESSHPIALLFYISFRVMPILIYILGNFLLGFMVQKNRFILHFIILILFIATDFWNTKNIAARLLVGLRWWNEINPSPKSGEYENVWVFESADPARYINPIDLKMFWIFLYAQPIAWMILGFLALLKFQFLYFMLVAIALALSITNGMAFTKCDKFGKANNLAVGILGNVTNSMFSSLNPFR